MLNATSIAIVDDDEGFGRSLAALLRSEGYVPAVFASGFDYLEALAEQRPALLLLDANMPGMDGYKVHAEAAELGRAVPTIMITAQATDAMRERAAQAGMHGFLQKPVAAGPLLSAIDDALRVYSER